MADLYNSTSNIRRVEKRELAYNIIEGETSITGPLSALSTGYEGYVDISIEELNLGIQVPEISVIHRTYESLGGGVSRLYHNTAPYVLWNTNGTIQSSIAIQVYYDYTAQPGEPLPTSTFIRIKYYNRSSTNGIDGLFYKIKSSDATNGNSI